jgi:ribulose-phosphate 3-epimerase
MVENLMTRNRQLEELRAASPVVLPSVLGCDFGNLARDIDQLEAAGVQAIHLDVMDGHFVPNLSFGLPLVEAIRRLTDLPLDVHLMISNPGEYLSSYVEAGADMVTIHIEVVDDARPLLEEIRALGAGAGLALNPPTPISAIEAALPACDFVLVMSVMPGFGGQRFDEVALDKLRNLRTQVDEHVLLEVDGGVNEETIAACVEAGAGMLVVGSAITGQDNYRAKVDELNQLAHAAV